MSEREFNINRIALTGKMRSGKSTISNYLTEIHDYKRIAFGDALKRYAHEIFDGLFDSDAEMVAKPRRLYRQFGQKMREIDSDVWVKQVERKMNAWESVTVHGIVIDDLRQPNEFEWARANGFTIIRINANEDTRLERARAAGDDFSLEDLRHETELHVDDFVVDFDYWNDSEDDLDAITASLDALILALGGD